MRDLLLWMMKTNRKERPTSVKEIMDFLNGSELMVNHDSEATLIDVHEREMQQRFVEPDNDIIIEDDEEAAKNTKKTKKAIIIAACAGLLIAVACYFLFNGGSGSKESGDAVERVDTTTTQVVDELLEIPLGPCKYTGPVNQAGMPHGKGVAKFIKTPDKCKGTFINGNVEGDSIVYTYGNGDTFVGSYKNNHVHRGRYTWTDGSYFEGFFIFDKTKNAWVPDQKRGIMHNP
jgi:hypothetical protein